MTEPKRFQLKGNSAPREVMARQTEFYARALLEREGVDGYAIEDAAFTIQWWNRWETSLTGEPLLVNRLRGYPVTDFNELIRPETIAAMGRLSGKVTPQRLWDEIPSECGCGR